MNTSKLMVCVTLAALAGAVAMDAATARVRAVRNGSAAKAAAVTSTPEERENWQDNRQDRQDSRQENWNNASPNQKAVTYNAAKSRHQQNVNRQAAGAAALSKRR
jgi:hypothetical protein